MGCAVSSDEAVSGRLRRPRSRGDEAVARSDTLEGESLPIAVNISESSPDGTRGAGTTGKKLVTSPQSQGGRIVCTADLVDALPRFTAPASKSPAAKKQPPVGTPNPNHVTEAEAVVGGMTMESPTRTERPSRGGDARQSLIIQASTLDVTTVSIAINASSNGTMLLNSPEHHLSPLPSPSRPGSRDCSICLMPIGGTVVVTTACLHTFHYECAKVWLTLHDGTCPDCRTRVRVEDFSFPQEVDGDAEIAERLFHDTEGTEAPHRGEDDDAVRVDDDDAIAASQHPGPVGRPLEDQFAAAVASS